LDRKAIAAIGETLAGSDRPFVVTSGLAGHPSGRVVTESDAPLPGLPRTSEDALFAFTGRGVRTSVVRLPPTTHGRGDHGFVPRLITIARDKGVSAYPGDGSNRWPAAHRLDAAKVFVGALEHAPAGAVLHAVDEQGVATRDIAGAIGRGLGLPVRAVAVEEAFDHFGWLGGFFSVDVQASATQTRELLGWNPTQVKLLDDLEQGHYFHDRAA
jgi:nucleoside-diphosphate-sugar epimerase